MTSSWANRASKGSFTIRYDAEADILDVRFGDDDAPCEVTRLNDHILLATDPDITEARGLTFLEYARLLLVSETEFTALRDLATDTIETVLWLVSTRPAGAFFDLTDVNGLIARITGPSVESLVGAGQ